MVQLRLASEPAARLRPFVATLAALLLLTAAGCGSRNDAPTSLPEIPNHPPEIRSITLNPAHPHTSERVDALVVATDEDRGDRLIYLWTITRGTLLEGERTRSVAYRTAGTPGRDTIRVRVSDGIETVTRAAVVDLIPLSPPGELSVRNGDRLVILRWAASPDSGIEGWAGYEVYRGTSSVAVLPDSEALAYRITPDPLTTRTLYVYPLTNGLRYFFHVRALRRLLGDESRSGASPELQVAPRPEGQTGDFLELHNPNGAFALDFSESTLRPLDPGDASGIAGLDLYLGTADSLDSAGPLYLKSISKLSNRNPSWAARNVGIKTLGTTWEVSTTVNSGFGDEVAVAQNGVYAVRLPEGNFAKLQVLAIGGRYPNRFLQIRWAYQLIPHFASF